MAICGRCGRPIAAGDVCPSCGVYATATTLVGAQAGSASGGGASAASSYGAPRTDGYSFADPDRRFRYERVEPEFAALPHWERPFAADRTIWPADSRLAPAATTGAAAAADRGTGRPEQRDPRQPEQQRRAEDVADGAREQSPGAAQPPESPRTGRWIALTAAMAVVFVAAAATVTVVLQHGWSRQRAPADKPPVAAAPSSSATTSAAPASASQLRVDFAAATAPDGAAITASLDRYFDAINNRDYLAYRQLFIRALRGGLSPAAFHAEFAAAVDSGEQLHSIGVIGGGRIEAFVTVIGRPPAGGRPASPTCMAWRVEFYFGKRGGRYLLVGPPLWHDAASSSCF